MKMRSPQRGVITAQWVANECARVLGTSVELRFVGVSRDDYCVIARPAGYQWPPRVVVVSYRVLAESIDKRVMWRYLRRVTRSDRFCE
jgi:hypothetical protein